jgi:hypothetical protein
VVVTVACAAPCFTGSVFKIQWCIALGSLTCILLQELRELLHRFILERPGTYGELADVDAFGCALLLLTSRNLPTQFLAATHWAFTSSKRRSCLWAIRQLYEMYGKRFGKPSSTDAFSKNHLTSELYTTLKLVIVVRNYFETFKQSQFELALSVLLRSTLNKLIIYAYNKQHTRLAILMRSSKI